MFYQTCWLQAASGGDSAQCVQECDTNSDWHFHFFSHCLSLEIARSDRGLELQVVNIPDLTPDSDQSISLYPGMLRSQEAIFICQILIGLFSNLNLSSGGSVRERESPCGILSVYWNYKSHPGVVTLIGMIILILIWVTGPDRNTC